MTAVIQCDSCSSESLGELIENHDVFCLFCDFSVELMDANANRTSELCKKSLDPGWLPAHVAQLQK